MFRISRLHISFLELLEVLAIRFQFARPRIDEPHVDALCLRAKKAEVVDVRCVEGADQQDAMVKLLRRLVQVERSLLHVRSEEHTSELQSLMRISSAVFC